LTPFKITYKTLNAEIYSRNFDAPGADFVAGQTTVAEFTHFENIDKTKRKVGDKHYEMANHLGNVLNVVTDRKVGNVAMTGYEADIVSYSDYSPFGMQMPGRNGNTSEYKYGFNGMEKDDEIKNVEGSSYDFGARIYDPRVGRWLSVDPLESKYPSLSPYSFAGNNPILFVDPNGEDILIHYLDEEGNDVYYTYGSGLKLPRDKYVRATVRSLDKIQRRGGDKYGIIEHYTKSDDHDILVYLPENMETTININMPNRVSLVFWHPQMGILSDDGARQNPASGLMHELAEAYYAEVDQDGRVGELLEILNNQTWSKGEWAIKLDEYETKQKEASGEYDTYSDMWIIQNVEPTFDDAFNQNSRKTHSGVVSYTNRIFSNNGKTKEERGGIVPRDKYNAARRETVVRAVADKVIQHRSRGV